MKIGFACKGDGGLDDCLSMHLGRSRTFTIVNEDGTIEIIKNTSEHFGGTGHPPDLLKQYGVNVLICGGMGPHAIRLLEQYNIKVFLSEAVKISDALAAYKAGKLKEFDEKQACSEGHHHHNHNHNHK